jgi:O-antigen/teichoic acid export membrane protein
VKRTRQIIAFFERSETEGHQDGLLKQFTDFLFGATAYKSYLSIADRIVVSGTNFLTLVVVGRVCGLEDLGIFVLAWTVLLATNVIQEAFVLSPFTVFVGKFKEEETQKAYAGATLTLQMFLAAMAMAVVFIAATIMTSLGGDSVIRIASWFLLIAIPAVSMREYARRFMFARRAAAQVLALDTIVAFLQFGGLGWFWYSGLLSPGSTFLLIAVATGLPAIIWLILNRSFFNIAERAVIATETRRHWSFGRWVCAAQMSDLAITHGVAWLIAVIAGTAATGIFAACNSIVMVINPLLLGIGSILLPRAAQANHQHGRDEVGRIVWKVTMVLAMSVGLLSLAVALNGEYLIGAFYSLESLDGVQETVFLLAIASFAGATSFAIENGLMVINRPDVNLAASTVSLVVTFSMAILLTPSFGVIGTAMGVLIGILSGTLYQIVAFIRLVGGPAGPVGTRAGPGH